jgi:hypothetical protein
VRGRDALRCETPPLSLHSASPRLCTGEPQHLVCFWPSPTFMSRWEHHLCAPGVRWWVRTVRFCVCMGWITICKTTQFSLHSVSPRLRTGEPQHLVCFWPSPTSIKIRNTIFAHPECGGGSGRAIYFCVGKGCISMQNTPILAAFGITPSPHR